MRLLITGAWQNAKENLDAIRAMGHEVLFLQQEREELPCAYAWAEGVICNGLFLYHPLEKFENLRYIQLTSAGLDRVDVAAVARRGIVLHNARGVYSIPMAEYALGGVLQLYKQFASFRENQKCHLWEKHRGLLELSGKTVCIVGCGSVGSECARRFSAFGCRVVGIATSRRTQPYFDAVRGMADLDAVLAETDVVVLSLPLTENTRHLMNEARLTALKSGAVLVNISRGGIVDTAAVLDALNRGSLSGAVLDVFEEEPLGQDSPLWDMENVILTPHNSFVGDHTQQRLRKVILENLSGC